MSPYLLFCEDERPKLADEENEELIRRWENIDPASKRAYEQKFQECLERKERGTGQNLAEISSTVKKGESSPDGDVLKKPLTPYMLFSREETLKIINEFPNHSVTEHAKEIGRRWAALDPAIKANYKAKCDDSLRYD